MSLFRGVLYEIRLSPDDVATSAVLKRLLEDDGGKVAPARRSATRIITNSRTVVGSSVRSPGVIVSPEWVYSSVKAGVKQPARYYSADPELFFSSIVVSACCEIEPSSLHEYRSAVLRHGGQWLDIPTEETTHIISRSFPPSPASIGPVIIFEQRFLDSIARKERLPNVFVGGQEVSAARVFCNALLARPPVPPTIIDAGARDIVQVIPRNSSRRDLPYLPYELLAEVFLIFREALDSRDLVRPLWRLPHVCARWRLVAHNTAELWTRIYFHFHSEKGHRGVLNHVNRWINLSAPLPITLHVQSCYPRAPNPGMDWIIENAHRIHVLHLILPEPHFQPLLQHPSVLFPALEELTLKIIPKSMTVYKPELALFDSTRDDYFEGTLTWWWDDPWPEDSDVEEDAIWQGISPMRGFRGAPRLRSITMDAGLFGTLSRSALGLVPWNQLTDIDLRAQRLALRLGWAESSPPPMPRISLPLSKLYLECDNAGDEFNATSFLAPLVLPALESLEITAYDDEIGLLDLHSRSSFALQHLALTGVHVSFARFSHFLRDMSCLTSLELVDYTVDDQLLNFLTFDRLAPVLPVLEILKVGRYSRPRFSDLLMMQMVQSRFPLGCHTVETRASSAIGESEDARAVRREVIDWLLETVEAGLDILYEFRD
ncbi:hypothetical protein FB45DRAFT_1064484 [Roridomyces roridus]|uniref:BRCT domain-containing protein n=1 Tax=Roridomyces roridus TaxID=1738132 RepID=A0AAD7BA62_9AGAR|nr:hypothetical protein FB45DRAFT_1064484 [Roridomyces roridus]